MDKDNDNFFSFTWTVRSCTERSHRLFCITGTAERYDCDNDEYVPAGTVRAYYAGDCCDAQELAVITDAESSDAIDMASVTLHEFDGGDWLGIHWFQDMPDFDCRLAAVKELLVLYPHAETFIDTRKERKEGEDGPTEDETEKFLETFEHLGFRKVGDSNVDVFETIFGDEKPGPTWSPPALIYDGRDIDDPPIDLGILRPELD